MQEKIEEVSKSEPTLEDTDKSGLHVAKLKE